MAAVAVLYAFAGCSSNNGRNGKATYTVSEKEWIKAFSAESFKNVTFTQYWDDTNHEKPRIGKIDGKLGYSNGYGAGGSSDGTSYSSVSDNWFYVKDGKNFVISKTVGTYYPSGKVETKWENQEHSNGHITPKVVADLISTMGRAFSTDISLCDYYKNFTYDSELKLYKGTVKEETEWSGQKSEDVFDITVAFENGKVTEIKYTRTSGTSVSETRAYYMSDYGKTKLELPEIPKS